MNGNRRKWLTVGLAGTVLGVLLLAGIAGALPTGTTTSSVASANGTVSTAAGSAKLPTAIKHVFLIMMENEETGVIYGNQPYQTYLANTYAWGGDANSNPGHVGYYAVCHPSAPNYLALTSGKPLQCGSDAYNQYSVNNLGNMLDTAGLSWTAWEESATSACQENNSANGLYVVRHNPFPYYSDLGGNASGSACSTHVLPIANLTADYPYHQTPPAFTYIAPNILDDAHSSSAAFGDYWLSTFIPKLIAQPWFSSSVIFITYDEAYGPKGYENFSGYDGLYGGPVYTVAVSPYTVGMGALDQNESHYDLLTTMEMLLGLGATGTGHDGTSQYPAITGFFQPRLFGPNVDLGGADLVGANLAGDNLAGDNLRYTDLAGATLAGTDLAGAKLEYADLAGADLQRANLSGASLQYADLQGANLRGADLSGASLQYADLASANLRGLSSTKLTDFNGANLDRADLSRAHCGASPNYISAYGANTNAVSVPASCSPPL